MPNRPPTIDPLTRLYVEITTTCNLDCQMSERRAWQEPAGRMSVDAFSRLLEQVSRMPALPTLHLGGYGEPMHHPGFLEFVRQAKSIGARVEVTT
jgi:MoaA/NifB/PqqE/SkfB family radical SAM enzyme